QELVAGLRIAHRGECAVHVGVGVYFFFASRRRHTRSKRDWSSDVCSSDLAHFASWCWITVLPLPKGPGTAATPPLAMGKKVSMRSEERRVGKERRCGGTAGETRDNQEQTAEVGHVRDSITREWHARNQGQV